MRVSSAPIIAPPFVLLSPDGPGSPDLPSCRVWHQHPQQPAWRSHVNPTKEHHDVRTETRFSRRFAPIQSQVASHRHRRRAGRGRIGVHVCSRRAHHQILITSTESPTFGGYSWPGVGQYEKIVGKAFGEVDPTDPKNAVIVDILLAPRNARGKVEYAFDFYILKPIDLTKGAHKVMYEPPNRGRKTWARWAESRPAAMTRARSPIRDVLANSFLMPRGYTMVVERMGRLGRDRHRVSFRRSPCRLRRTRTARRSRARRTSTS